MAYGKRWFRCAVVALLLAAFVTGCATTSSLRYMAEGDADFGIDPASYTPTFSYRLLEAGVRLSGYKKIYAGNVETLKARAEKFNKNKPPVPPQKIYRRFDVMETTVNNSPCFFIMPKQNVRTDSAVFFLYGGGFMLNIDFFHWNVIERIVDELSVPVCVPMYPIYPETDPAAIIGVINGAFSQLCALFPEARITALGDSSGAYLLLSLCHYLLAEDAARLPGQLICVSPAQTIAIDGTTLAEMKAIDKKDPVISIAILENLSAIFNLNDSDINWFSAPMYGDFSRFPPIIVFSGTHEIFYPLMRPFVERVRSQGTAITLYTGLRMPHVWPYMPLASESKYALGVILEIIDGNAAQTET
ncbi:MAG: alpha/beta hydrolase [Treponema sp.]|jgi:acetyl esterase/lipase|nr:alpha/beta hydrolase [Treponema sp.]